MNEEQTNTQKPQQRSYTYENAKELLTKKLKLVEFEMARVVELSSRRKSMKWSTDKYAKMTRKLDRFRSDRKKIEEALLELDARQQENRPV